VNCTVCESYGKCKVWKSEKEFYENFPAEEEEPMRPYSHIFEVTEQGAVCSSFKEEEEDKECGNCRHSEFISRHGSLYCHVHKRIVNENLCDKWGMKYEK